LDLSWSLKVYGFRRFIAIDFEHLGNIKQDSTQNSNSQVEIAILDAKDLGSSPPQTAISTFNDVTGSPTYRVAK